MTASPTIATARDTAVRLLTAFIDPAFAPMLPDMTLQLRPRPGDASAVFFAVEVLTCARCGGPRRIVGAVTDPSAVRRLLAALGLAAEPPPVAAAP